MQRRGRALGEDGQLPPDGFGGVVVSPSPVAARVAANPLCDDWGRASQVYDCANLDNVFHGLGLSLVSRQTVEHDPDFRVRRPAGHEPPQDAGRQEKMHVFRRAIPALFTGTAIGPIAWVTCRIISVTWLPIDTSAWTATAWPPGRIPGAS
jgi:hypothetical protein